MNKDYENIQKYFDSDYDRTNPVTKKNAYKDWLLKIEANKE
jgi:hypothetical protein